MSKSFRLVAFSVFHNRPEFLEESVRSLIDQDVPADRIVLVDDCSDDGETLRALKRFESESVIVLRSPFNMGFTRCIRWAIEQFDCNYVAVHGAGDVSYPQRFARQLAMLDASPEVAVVGCLLRRHDDSREELTSWLAPGWYGEMTCLPKPVSYLTSQGSLYTHGEAMFRRSAYDAVGGYRTAYPYAQDHDLWIRMSHGYDFGLVRETLYLRRNLASGVSRQLVKLCLQRKLSWMARECGEQQAAGRPDWVDLYGDQAVQVFAHPRASTEVAKYCLMALATMPPSQVRRAMRIGAGCNTPTRSFVSMLLLLTPERGMGRSLVTGLIRRLARRRRWPALS